MPTFPGDVIHDALLEKRLVISSHWELKFGRIGISWLALNVNKCLLPRKAIIITRFNKGRCPEVGFRRRRWLLRTHLLS